MRTTIQAVALSVIAMVITLTGGNAFALHRQTPFEEPIPFPAIQGAQSFRPSCQGAGRALDHVRLHLGPDAQRQQRERDLPVGQRPGWTAPPRAGHQLRRR